MDFSDKIAERLKLLRAEHNMTMKEVAAATNIPFRTYVKYESGTANPVLKNLYTLAEFYQVSLDYLTCRTMDKKVHYL